MTSVGRPSPHKSCALPLCYTSIFGRPYAFHSITLKSPLTVGFWYRRGFPPQELPPANRRGQTVANVNEQKKILKKIFYFAFHCLPQGAIVLEHPDGGFVFLWRITRSTSRIRTGSAEWEHRLPTNSTLARKISHAPNLPAMAA